MRSTAELRSAWAPACRPRLIKYRAPNGVEYPQGIDSRCKEAFDALHAVFGAWGYVLRTPGCWGYLCRSITGGSGYSLHAYGIPLDVNAPANPYGPRLVTDMPRAMVEAGLAIRTKGGHQVFGWGGNYRRNKDAMHWEVVASPAELALGIDWSTVAGANHEEDNMNGDQEALLRQVFDQAKGAHQTANRLEERVALLEAAMIDASGVTAVQWSRRTVRLARLAAAEAVRAMYARTGRPLATGDETAIERSWRHVDEIETRTRPGGGARDGMELELTLEDQVTE